MTPRLNDPTFLVSRPLGSTPTPASRSFTATTGRSASERRDWYSVPSVSASARSLSRPWGLRPRATVSTLAFSRSVQEPQTRLTPPLRRAPPGQYTGTRQAHPEGKLRSLDFDAVFPFNDASTAHAHPDLPADASGTSSWSPPDASSRAFSLIAHHDGLQPTQHQGGLAPAPVGRRWRASNPPSPAQHRLHEESST